MTATRWKDPGRGLGSFADEFLIVCPRCGKQARVARTWNDEHRHWRKAAMTCSACGLTRRAEARLCCHRCPVPQGSRWVGPAILSARCRCARCGVWLEVEKTVRVPPKADWLELSCERCEETTRSSYQLHAVPLSREAADLCFGLPLWLQTPCEGHTLWAFNARHLAFLRAYVSASLREKSRNNASAAARLPGWLKRANRSIVLRALARLEQRCPVLQATRGLQSSPPPTKQQRALGALIRTVS